MGCSLNQMSESIQAYAEAFQATACLFQDKVDETIKVLKQEQAIALNQKLQAESFISRINDCEATTEFDPDDKISGELLYIEEVLRDIYATYKSGLDAALKDHNLTSAHKRSIVIEYKRTMSAITEHYTANEKLRLIIMEVDADLSPVSEFDNTEDLIAELNS